MSQDTPDPEDFFRVPLPRASPRYKNKVGDSPTGKYRALKKQFQWGGLAAGLALVGTIAGGVLSVQGVSRASAQEQVAPLKADVEVTKQQLAFLQTQLQLHLVEEQRLHTNTDAKVDKQEANQQVIMDALHVPQWRRPDPVVLMPALDAGVKDGGR